MFQNCVGFISYNSLNYESDAFLQLDNIDTFYDFEIYGKFSNNKLDNEKYTAGNTNNPDDYSLPNIEKIINPNSILRLNPFEKISTNSIDLHDIEFNEEEKEEELISQESINILNYFKNNKKQNNSKKHFSNIIFSSDNSIIGNFEIKPRNINQNISSKYDENFNQVQMYPSNEKVENILNEVYNSQNITNTEFDYNTSIQNNRNVNSYNDFSYDVNNSNSFNYHDFTENNNTFNVMNEFKSEVLQKIDNTINNLEQKIITQNTIKQEIRNVENKITQVIEEKLNEREDVIVKKINEKSEKDFKDFKFKFLNS